MLNAAGTAAAIVVDAIVAAVVSSWGLQAPHFA
jgi:hypothetical protein